VINICRQIIGSHSAQNDASRCTLEMGAHVRYCPLWTSRNSLGCHFIPLPWNCRPKRAAQKRTGAGYAGSDDAANEMGTDFA
jgi:hypothetical protein